MTVPNQLDEQYTFDVQDPGDPVWETDANIAEMTGVDDPADQHYEQAPRVRTSSGELSFVDVVDAVDSFLERDVPKPQPKPKLDDIRTRELGSDKWRPGRRAVTATMSYPIVTESSKRRSVTLINYGPNVVYLSNMGGVVAGASNTVQLLVSSATFWAPLPIPTKDNVWAVCAPTESAAVEVVEVFDMEE